MLIFSIITFVIAAVILVTGIMVYRGRTELIHSYHQTRVTDKKGYGRAIGKSLIVLSIGIFASGIVALLGDSDAVIIAAVVLLFAAIIAGLVCIYKTQKRYNGGMF